MGTRAGSPNVGHAIPPTAQLFKQFLMHFLLPTAILLVLALWATSHPAIPLPTAPNGAMIVLTIITLGAAFVARAFRLRFDLDKQTALALPDPLYTLYLATLILIGPPQAVLLAIITPLVECLPDLLHGSQALQALRLALRQATAAALTMFCASLVFFWVSQTFTPQLSALRAHIAGALIASILTCIGAAAMQIIALGLPVKEAIRRYVTSPSLRFQVLLLSVGPLLPLAELLDDIDAEFAWLLFLVPLFAVYYLALVSVRLEQRTNELQKTVAALEAARRREAELTDYAALITRAQEDERRRLSRELHDDTAQALIALSRGLDALASRQVEPPLSSYDVRFTEDLSELTKRTLDSVRRACQDLRPSVLDDLGLCAALESLAHSESNRGPECTFHQHGESFPCAPWMEVTIYRIAQESLANARQHAKATKTTLDIHYSANSIELRVTDNGEGFDPQAVLRASSAKLPDGTEPRSGLGLLGMRERAALIRAHLSIASEPNSGTTVTLKVPLPPSH